MELRCQVIDNFDHASDRCRSDGGADAVGEPMPVEVFERFADGGIRTLSVRPRSVVVVEVGRSVDRYVQRRKVTDDVFTLLW